MMRWDGQDEKSVADTSNVSRSDGSPFRAKLPVGGYLGRWCTCLAGAKVVGEAGTGANR